MSRVNSYYLNTFKTRIDATEFAIEYSISPLEIERWLQGGKPSDKLKVSVLREMRRLGIRDRPPGDTLGLTLGELDPIISRIQSAEVVMVVDGDQNCTHDVDDYFTESAPIHVFVVGNIISDESKWAKSKNSKLKTFVTAGSNAPQAADLTISALVGILHARLNPDVKISLVSGDDFSLVLLYSLESLPRTLSRVDCASEHPMVHLIKLAMRDGDVLMASLGVINRFTHNGNLIINELNANSSDYANLVINDITVRDIVIEKQRILCATDGDFADSLRRRISKSINLMNLGRIATSRKINPSRATEWFWGRRPCMPGAIFAFRRELGEL